MIGRAEEILVHAVEAPPHPVGAEREAEVLLHVGGPGALRLLLVPEARQGRATRRLARLLVLPGEEALVLPLPLEHRQEILQRRVVAGHAAQEVELDDLVDGVAVHHRVVAQDGHAQHVDVAVLQRAGIVVVHLAVAQEQLLLGGNGRRRVAPALRGRREALDLLDGLGLERPRGVLGQVERLEHELADLARAGPAVVAGAGEEELAPRPRHAHVEEAALLAQVEVALGQRVLDQLRGHLQGLAPPAQGELVLHQIRPGRPRGTPAPWPCAR